MMRFPFRSECYFNFSLQNYMQNYCKKNLICTNTCSATCSKSAPASFHDPFCLLSSREETVLIVHLHIAVS